MKNLKEVVLSVSTFDVRLSATVFRNQEGLYYASVLALTTENIGVPVYRCVPHEKLEDAEFDVVEAMAALWKDTEAQMYRHIDERMQAAAKEAESDAGGEDEEP